MEDKYDHNFLAFIATHTDVLRYSNVVEQQQGKDKALTAILKDKKQQKDALDAITKQCKAIKKKLTDVNAEIKPLKGDQGEVSQTLQRKRKREDMDETTESRLEVFQEQRKTLLRE